MSSLTVSESLAERQYASAIKILQTLKQREDATSSNPSQLGSASTSFQQSPSRLLSPVSQTPVLDYLEHALDGRTRVLGHLVRGYRRLTGKNSKLGSEDASQSSNQHDAQDLMAKIVRNKYLRMSSKNIKSSQSKRQQAVEAAVERLEKAYALGKADAALLLADLSLVCPRLRIYGSPNEMLHLVGPTWPTNQHYKSIRVL